MPSRLAAVLVLLAAVPAAAEERRPNLVLIHPWAGGVSYERAVLDHLSLSLGVAFNETQAKFGSENNAFLAASITPGASWFLTGTAPEGLWVGVRWSFAYTHNSVVASGPSTTKAYGGAVMFGYDAILGPGVALQAAVGLGAGGGSTSSSGGTATLGGLGTLSGMGFASTGFSTGLRTLLGLGWAF